MPETDQPAATPRRFYYGWVVLGVCIAGYVATSPGQSYVVALFNLSLQEAAGVGERALSTAYMLGTVASAFLMTPVGAWSDRVGPRRAMIVFALGVALAGMLAGHVSGFASLLLVFFLLRFFGQGALGLASGHLTALWFDRKLSTAEGFKAASMSLAVVLLPAAVIALIAALGWQRAYAALGLSAAALVVPLAWLVAKDRPEDAGQYLDGDPAPHLRRSDQPPPPDDPAFRLRQALATFCFWPLVLSGVLSGLIGTAMIFHIQPMLLEVGRDPEAAKSIIPAWGITSGVVVLFCGPLADRLRPAALVVASMVLLFAATAVLTGLETKWAGSAAFGLFGLSQGINILVVGPSVARFFGRAHHGSIRGFVTMLGVGGTSVGPLMLSLFAGWLGSFERALWPMACLTVPVMVAAAFIRRPQAPNRAPNASGSPLR